MAARQLPQQLMGQLAYNPPPPPTACLQASLAAGIVDAVLIPEVQFSLEGERGLLAFLDKRMRDKGHCVVVVAEGAGQVREPAADGGPSGAAATAAAPLHSVASAAAAVAAARHVVTCMLPPSAATGVGG